MRDVHEFRIERQGVAFLVVNARTGELLAGIPAGSPAAHERAERIAAMLNTPDPRKRAEGVALLRCKRDGAYLSALGIVPRGPRLQLVG